MELSWIQKVNIIKQLHKNCKEGTAIESEFTVGKYDFLLEQGLLSVPHNKLPGFKEKALEEYKYELQNMVNTGTLVEGHTAAEVLIRIDRGEISFNQREYLSKKIKILALKEFLYNAETIGL